jgi:D-alanyl-D-alanine dipeptidase
VTLPAPPWSHAELRFMVRPEVAERLAQAAGVLPEDVRLGFWEGLRPIAVQQTLWETGLVFMHRNHPNLALGELELALEPFIARPDGITPPHSTGSAVDVAALDVFRRVLSPGDPWGRIGSESLARALADTGMARYDPEWWHWSYGDHEWARAYDCKPLDFIATQEFDGPGGGI